MGAFNLIGAAKKHHLLGGIRETRFGAVSYQSNPPAALKILEAPINSSNSLSMQLAARYNECAHHIQGALMTHLSGVMSRVAASSIHLRDVARNTGATNL